MGLGFVSGEAGRPRTGLTDMYRVVRFLGPAVAVAAALSLGACDHPEVEKVRIALGGWTQERMLADGWLQASPEEPMPAYCYHTLADPDCLIEPVPGEQVRRTVPDRTPDE